LRYKHPSNINPSSWEGFELIIICYGISENEYSVGKIRKTRDWKRDLRRGYGDENKEK